MLILNSDCFKIIFLSSKLHILTLLNAELEKLSECYFVILAIGPCCVTCPSGAYLPMRKLVFFLYFRSLSLFYNYINSNLILVVLDCIFLLYPQNVSGVILGGNCWDWLV